MLQEYYHGSSWLWLPMIGLLFFFVFFLVVLVRVALGMRDPERVERLASLPFSVEAEHAAGKQVRDE